MNQAVKVQRFYQNKNDLTVFRKKYYICTIYRKRNNDVGQYEKQAEHPPIYGAGHSGNVAE
jgi:hypothetical protein